MALLEALLDNRPGLPGVRAFGGTKVGFEGDLCSCKIAPIYPSSSCPTMGTSIKATMHLKSPQFLSRRWSVVSQMVIRSLRDNNRTPLVKSLALASRLPHLTHRSAYDGLFTLCAAFHLCKPSCTQEDTHTENDTRNIRYVCKYDPL